MNPKKPDPVRVLDVISSCKDIEQLTSARTYAKLWLKRHVRWWQRDAALLPGLFFEFIKDKWKLLKLQSGEWGICHKCAGFAPLNDVPTPHIGSARLCPACESAERGP